MSDENQQPQNNAQNLPAAVEADPLKKFTAEAAAVDKAAGVGQQPEAQAAPTQGSAEPAAQATIEEPVMSPLDEASAIVTIITGGLRVVYPVLEYQEDVKEEAAQKLAPLIKKYGGNSMLAKWEAEIEAGLFFGSMVYQSILMVRADKAQAAEEKAQAEAAAAGKIIEAAAVKPSRFANFAKWFKRK